MTAVGIWVCPDKVVIASDAVSYDEHGIVRQIRSKQIVDLGWGVAITASGASGSLLALRAQFQSTWVDPPRSLDEFLVSIPAVAEKARDWLGDVYKDRDEGYGPPEFMWLFGGYSDVRSRYEGYFLASEVPNNDVGLEPFLPFQVQAYAKPQASDDALKEVGLFPLPGTVEDPRLFAVQLMLAQRKTKMPLHTLDGLIGYGVGGFCQVTTLERDAADSLIMLRWPDKIGEVIDPIAAGGCASLVAREAAA